MSSTKEERQAISQACDQLKEILLKKNHDYGNSFGETFNELGPISGLTRFIDKVNRLKELILHHDQEINDESLNDTWLDAAGYAILNYIHTKQLQPESHEPTFNIKEKTITKKVNHE